MYPITDGPDDYELTEYQTLYRKMGVTNAFVSNFLCVKKQKAKDWSNNWGDPVPDGVVDDMKVLNKMLDDLKVRFWSYLDAK